MSKKLEPAKKFIDARERFQIKEASGGGLVIEGWANKAVRDRGEELIVPEAWDLENYGKNGVILFNHDMDKPIGKCVDVKAMDGGLWIKARISKSKDPMVSYVRDMISEGILNSFSVGFNPLESKKAVDSDGKDITKAELYECSVVSIPMNQDSQFAHNAKSLKSMTYHEVRASVLQYKGALVAEAVHAQIYKLLDENEEFIREDALKAVAEKAGVELSDVSEVLAGNVTPVPEGVVLALAEVFALDAEELKAKNASDAVAEKKETEPVKEDPKEDPAAATPPAKEDPKEETPVEEELEPESKLLSIRVPKKSADTAVKAVSLLRESGYLCVSVGELPEHWEVFQVEKESIGKTIGEVSLGDEIAAVLGHVKKSKPVQKNLSDGPSTPVGDSGAGDQNPYLQEARQTNVLLSVLIEEIKGLRSFLSETQKPATAVENTLPSETPAPEKTEDAENVTKALENMNALMGDYKKSINDCMKRLEVLT